MANLYNNEVVSKSVDNLIESFAYGSRSSNPITRAKYNVQKARAVNDVINCAMKALLKK